MFYFLYFQVRDKEMGEWGNVTILYFFLLFFFGQILNRFYKMAWLRGQLCKRRRKFSKHLPWPQLPSGTSEKGICHHTRSGQRASRLGILPLAVSHTSGCWGGPKPSSPSHATGMGLRVQLGTRGDIFEGEPALPKPSPQSCRAGLSHGRTWLAVHSWHLAVPRATRHHPSQGWHLANGLNDQAVPSQQSSHRSRNPAWS